MKIKDNSVTWQVLEGEEEKEELKKIIEAQQETYNRSRGRGKCCYQMACLKKNNKPCKIMNGLQYLLCINTYTVLMCLVLKVAEDDQGAEEEEGEGEEVAGIMAEVITKAKRRNLKVKMKTMVWRMVSST